MFEHTCLKLSNNNNVLIVVILTSSYKISDVNDTIYVCINFRGM